MNHKMLTLALPIFFFCFCKNTKTETPPPILATAKNAQNPGPGGETIATRFPPETGFVRVSAAPNSFAGYLQNLPLKTPGTSVFHFDGSEKPRQDVHAAVVDMDVGRRDLQQCADAVMRLRAEHLFAEKKYSEIRFNFTNGFPAEYRKWRAGNRISVKGNKVGWIPTGSESRSYASFRKYLDMVFSYAGTLSLAKEMSPVALPEMQIGDVFIQGGSPGHAVIVVDMAVNADSGEKQFLLAQSYMPAQDIHVLKKPAGGAWYGLDFGEKLRTPEWTFGRGDLKRF